MNNNQQQATDMRRIAIIFLIWPMIVMGSTSTDALPPYGIWECVFETGYDCDWKDRSKSPHCVLPSDEELKQGFVFSLNLESSPKTSSYPGGDWELLYIGPEGGAWTLLHAETFFDSRVITIVDPSNGKFHLTVLDTRSPFRDLGYAVGTCTIITLKESEEPTEGEDTPARD